MKNRASIFVIIFIVFIAVIAFVVITVSKQPNLLTELLTTPSNQELNKTVKATLFLEPSVKTVKIGDTVRFIARIESAAQLTGIQATLRYNPQAITIESIEPGSLFTKPEILIDTIDNIKGIISYSIGTFSPTLANGEVFIITATVVNEKASYLLTFDQSKTKAGFFDSESQQPFSELETYINFVENQ